MNADYRTWWRRWASGHLTDDELLATCLAARGANTSELDVPCSAPSSALHDHLARCEDCAQRLARIEAEVQELPLLAADAVDALVPSELLERQQAAILRRLDGARSPARVLPFPLRSRRLAPPGSSHQKWIALAATAGLMVGLVTGRFVNLTERRSPWVVERRAARTVTPAAIVNPRGTAPGAALASDEALLIEVEAALLGHRSLELRALDALTPRVR